MSLFGLFARLNDHDATIKSAHAHHDFAPGTTISYDTRLITHLVRDHRRLVDIYNQIHKALAHKDMAGVQERLLQFRSALQEHLLKENVRLYVYLARYLANDENSSQLINDMRREMMKIGRVVMDFLRKYTEAPIDPSQAAQLQTELEGIGAALVQRIEREETALYPLYMQHY